MAASAKTILQLPASLDQTHPQQRWMWSQQPTRGPSFTYAAQNTTGSPQQQQQQPQLSHHQPAILRQQQDAQLPHHQPSMRQQPQHIIHAQAHAQPYQDGTAQFGQMPLQAQSFATYMTSNTQQHDQLPLLSSQLSNYAYAPATSPQYPQGSTSPQHSHPSPASHLTPSPGSATQPLYPAAPILAQPIPPSHHIAHHPPFSNAPLPPRVHPYQPRPNPWDAPHGDISRSLASPPRACVRCKRLKVRCENVNGTRPCKRCRNANQECVTAQRKQRPRKSDAARAAAAAASAADKDKSSGSSLPTPPGDAPPFSLASRASGDPDLSEEDTESSEEAGDDAADDANAPDPPQTLPEDNSPLWWIKELAIETGSGKKNKAPALGLTPDYFRGGQRNVPRSEIFTFMTEKEVGEMFVLFMEKINPYVSMFDEVLHTATSVGQRSPFLLTVIIAIASRYYTARPDVYPRAQEVVRKTAGDAITSGHQSIEHCQAFILLSMYPAPDRKYSDKRDWLYSGVAFRMATELGLGKPPPAPGSLASETAEREALNRTRTWIVCFYIDQSMSAHFGRPATFRPDDAVTRNAVDWARRSPYNRPDDLHLTLFVELLRLFRKFLDEANPEAEEAEKKIDYYALSEAFDGEVAKFEKRAESLFAQYSDRTNHISVLREKLVTFVTQYSRLIVHSTGFQKQVRRPGQAEDVFLERCMNAAFCVLSLVTDDIFHTGSLRYACDGYFWYTSFASAFLLKFLSPEHAERVDDALRERIVSAVQSLIDVLSSRDVAIDASHPPKLFSRFLAGMLAKHGKRPPSPDEPEPAAEAGPSTAPGTSYRPPTPALTASPPKSASGLTGSPATLPVTMPAPPPLPPTARLPDPIWPPPSESNGFGMEVDELMREVSPQEMNMGMYVLSNPHWWPEADATLVTGDLAAFASGAGSGDTTFPQTGTSYALDPAFLEHAYRSTAPDGAA